MLDCTKIQSLVEETFAKGLSYERLIADKRKIPPACARARISRVSQRMLTKHYFAKVPIVYITLVYLSIYPVHP